MSNETTQFCSFCGRSQKEVKTLIVGGSANICNECIDECRKSIASSHGKDLSKITMATPREIHQFLNKYVVGQEEVKKALSVAVYNHYQRILHPSSETEEVEINKTNVLLIGPTGSGKTLLAETLARFLNVPFAIADATTLTEAGYVGDDVETILQKLIQASDYDVSAAERGIIYIDEIDKIARKGDSASITRDVSGEGVQQALLKIIEGTVASVPPQGNRKHPQQEYLQINTKNILFICGGAFADLEKIIQERSDKSGIGFSATIYDKNSKRSLEKLLHDVKSEDLIKFGLIPEFVGRLPIITVLDELNEDELVSVLTEPKNALIKQYQQLFRLNNIELSFEPEAITAIAKQALDKKTGARGLRSMLEGILLDLMYEAPSDKTIAKIIINTGVVKGESAPILVRNSN